MLTDGEFVVFGGQEQGFSGADDPFNGEAVWLSKYNKPTAVHTRYDIAQDSESCDRRRCRFIGLYELANLYGRVHNRNEEGLGGLAGYRSVSNDAEPGAENILKLGSATVIETGFNAREEVAERRRFWGVGRVSIDQGDFNVAIAKGVQKVCLLPKSMESI